MVWCTSDCIRSNGVECSMFLKIGWITSLLVERVMIERREKEDIEIQIYKNLFIMNDNDRKKKETISLNPNLARYIDNTSTTLHEGERKKTKK